MPSVTPQTKPNRRRSRRIECKNTIVVNPQGACEIRDMSKQGFSFECMFDQNLTEEWLVDIIDDKGAYLAKVPVEKVWQSECTQKKKNVPCKFSVGVKFKMMSYDQQLTIEHLILSNETN